MLLFKTFEARFAPMSEDIKAVAVAILDGHVKISGRLDVLTDTVKRAQSETNMLVKESGDKIINAVSALAICVSADNLTRTEVTPLKIPSMMAKEVENTIIDDLSFGSMEVREESITPAHENTFKWILSDFPARSKPCPNLLQWLRNDGECYWISGKAGSMLFGQSPRSC
jgi:hypothetical protein